MQPNDVLILFCEFSSPSYTLENLEKETQQFWDGALRSMYYSGHFPTNLPVPLTEKNLTETDGHRVGNWVQALSPHLQNKYNVEYLLLPFDQVSIEQKIAKTFNQVCDQFDKIIVLLSYVSCHADIAVTFLKMSEEYKNIKTIIGGIHVSSICTSELTQLPADYIVLNEGDSVIQTTVERAISSKKTEDSLPIIIYGSAELKDRLWSWDLYLKHSTNINKYIPRISINRGCRNTCFFCSRIATTRQKKDIWEIACNWMDNFANDCGYKNVHFKLCDPEIEINKFAKSNALEFFMNRPYSWDCQMRVFRENKNNRDTLKMFKDSDCTSIFVGVESFQQHIIDACGKNVNAEDIIPCLQSISDQGIALLMPLMIGLPQQNEDDFLADLEMAVDLIKRGIVSTCLPQVLLLFPGTSYYIQNEKHKINLHNYRYKNLEKLIMHKTQDLSTEKIKQLYKKALRTLTEVHLNYANIK